MGPLAPLGNHLRANAARCGLAAWCTLIAALVAILSPWPWGVAAMFPLLAIAGFWRLLEPHRGYHAAMAPPVGLPDDRFGSMDLDAERRWRELHHYAPASWYTAPAPHWRQAGLANPQEPGAGAPGGGSPGEPPPAGNAVPPAAAPAPADPSPPPRPVRMDDGGGDGPAGGDEWDDATLAALAATPVDWEAQEAGERLADTMTREVLTPAVLEMLDKEREMAEDCAAYMQHAQVRWAALISWPLVRRPLIGTSHQEHQ